MAPKGHSRSPRKSASNTALDVKAPPLPYLSLLCIAEKLTLAYKVCRPTSSGLSETGGVEYDSRT